MTPAVSKWIAGVIGGITAMLLDTSILLVVCTIAILMDCYTAWELSKRVKKKYPKQSDGKFRSNKGSKILTTMLKIYSLIILAYLIDHYVLTMFHGLFLANCVTGIFCFLQIWSILENESSCNDSRWASIMQRIMVDKTERHFNIDLSELKHNKDESTN